LLCVPIHCPNFRQNFLTNVRQCVFRHKLG
jgi:hypothetical protein